jgi:hypothetical protein
MTDYMLWAAAIAVWAGVVCVLVRILAYVAKDPAEADEDVR